MNVNYYILIIVHQHIGRCTYYSNSLFAVKCLRLHTLYSTGARRSGFHNDRMQLKHTRARKMLQ